MAGAGSTDSLTRSVAIHEDVLALAEGFRGVRIADVSDPAHPVVVGSYGASDYVVDVTFSQDGYLYASLRTSGMLVSSIRVPPRRSGARQAWEPYPWS